MEASFQWDHENLAHIRRHDVSPEEFEQVFLNSPIEIGQQFEQGEERFLEIGETNKGRLLAVVYVWRGEQIRAVSAFAAKKAFVDYYFAEKTRHYGSTSEAPEI